MAGKLNRKVTVRQGIPKDFTRARSTNKWTASYENEHGNSDVVRMPRERRRPRSEQEKSDVLCERQWNILYKANGKHQVGEKVLPSARTRKKTHTKQIVNGWRRE